MFFFRNRHAVVPRGPYPKDMAYLYWTQRNYSVLPGLKLLPAPTLPPLFPYFIYHGYELKDCKMSDFKTISAAVSSDPSSGTETMV